MILTSRKINNVLLGIVLGCLCPFLAAQAQESVTLSVTPPLFQMAAEPEQVWQSSIKVVNTNSFPLTVYANPVNFMPVGEGGQGRFIPVFESETEGQTLAEWITVTDAPIVIPPETSKDVPFVVSVPDNAPPGGHFASILVGTKPPDNSNELAVRTSQVVSSLFFLTVAGDIVERAAIREFSVDESFTETPHANFILRFQNEGNVHVRPRGEIKIFNMWGKQRGFLPINQNSQYGNVLPETIRKFEFSWVGEASLADIGRYKAEVIVGYGNESWRTLTQDVYFWVIPIKLTLLFIFAIAVLIYLIRWAIRSYIRRTLLMAGIDPEERRREREAGSVVMNKKVSLEKASDTSESSTTRAITFFGLLLEFVKNYRYFFVGIPSTFLLLGALFWFLSGALSSERGFEATITQGDNEISVNSETLYKEELETTATAASEREQEFILDVVNASGEPGVGAAVAVELEAAGYVINDLQPELRRNQKSTAIIAPVELSETAQDISQLLGNALVSFSESMASTTDTFATIRVMLGQDQL